MENENSVQNNTITLGGCFPINATLSWNNHNKRFDLGTVYYSTKPPKNYKPIRIVFIDNKITKCTFADGDEIFITIKEQDSFDEEVGVALCIAHKLYRDEPKGKSKFRRAIKKLAEHPRQPEKKRKDSSIWKDYCPD